MQEDFMRLALLEAKKAFKKGEVPVGAVIVKDGQVVSKACNLRENKQNALCHAEVLAIDKACKKLKVTHLSGCDMYVTLEPCPMCSGAIIASRLDNVYFASSDDVYGCGGSVYNFFSETRFDSHTKIQGGFLSEEAKSLLQSFFAQVREKNKVKSCLGKSIDCKDGFEGNNQILNIVSRSVKFKELLASKKIALKSYINTPVLSFCKGKIVCVLQLVGSFDSMIVEGEKDISIGDIKDLLSTQKKYKIITKDGVMIVN